MTGQRTLVDTGAAAVAVHRSPVTIRRWLGKRWLERHGTDDGRRTLVDLAAVYRVDRELRAGRQPDSV